MAGGGGNYTWLISSLTQGDVAVILFPFHGRGWVMALPEFQAQGSHVAGLILPAGVEYAAVRELKSNLRHLSFLWY